MKRREFIQSSGALAASSFFITSPFARDLSALKNIGIQLFSLPKLLESDFAKAIQILSVMGYKEIELFGPFPFSAESAKKSWAQVTPSLGFSGSGYFGLGVNEVRDIMKKHGMTIPSVHTDYDTLQQNMEGLAQASSVLGFEYVCLPAIPAQKRKTLDDYKRVADDFNSIGESAKKHNLKFAYHNHGYGFRPIDGTVPITMLLEMTDPNTVLLEMDVYWTTAGGADPVEYLKKYAGRYHLMHVKDMKEKKTFSGDGGDPQQWIELFPYMTTAGSGVLDLKAIITQGQASGVKHFFVEQDMVASPEVALKKSADYLKTI
ncbi:MAG TPA: sugar phosphate isomerase/epimerase [Chryseosolibacter sp.]